MIGELVWAGKKKLLHTIPVQICFYIFNLIRYMLVGFHVFRSFVCFLFVGVFDCLFVYLFL